MRTQLLPLFVVAACFPLATLAQQTAPPQRGFSVKQKSGPADGDLSRRLNANETPLPANRRQAQTLAATGAPTLTLPPLRLRVVHDAQSGAPIYIENQSPAPSPANRQGRQSAAAATFSFLRQVRNLMAVRDPDQSFIISQTLTDELGQTHHRLTQTHRGLPVYGAELTVHLTNGEVTHVMGRYRNVPSTLTIEPVLSLSEAGKVAMSDVGRKAIVQMFGQNILKMEPVKGALCVYIGMDGNNVPARLAYDLTIRPNLMERWQYIVDAETGAVLHKFNNTCGVDGPVNATARDLNGVSRTFKTYLSGANYYLLDASRAMYSASKSKMPDSPVGAIWTIDAKNTYGDNMKVSQVVSTNNTSWTPTAVSAQYNGGIAYEYFLKTFNRNAINGNGGTIVSIINVNDEETGKGMDNAYWNGEYMFYGNGDVGFKPLAGALDVAGHEMSHGVIQNTANLNYQGQSGAINESYADVFGVLIDRDDWTVGEDVVQSRIYPSGALRSMQNPNQGGIKGDPNGYQPKTMAQYISTTEDNGGVHINSGIPNYAFYQIATAIGKDKAEQIYYRALTTYLTRSSQFIDLRLALVKAATDRHGASSAEVTAVKTAFDNVGITETSSTPKQDNPTIPTANGQDLIAVISTGDGKLYSTPYPSTAFTVRSTSQPQRRPSLTDDGKYAVFVGADKRIRAVDMTRPASETVISNETIWANAAISKDGTKLAALTANEDGKMYVYSFDLAKWQTFTLYNPTSASGVKTGEVAYADSFEWDYSGDYVIYDAFNKLNNASGSPVNFWDVGVIHVWDGAKKNFADGRIDKLFTDLDEGVSIGNPSFSKTSPDIVTFDYFDETSDTYYVISANVEKGDVKLTYENNTLGFPSYSRTDNAMVFTAEVNSKEVVGIISLEADKITPKDGTEKLLYNSAKWPVWYTNVARAIPTKANQTITFNAIADRFISAGNLTLSATSSANLPVGFAVKSGPAELVGTNQLKFTGTGTVTVRAFQEGNNTTYAATPVDRTFEVQALLAIEPDWSGQVRLFPNPTRSRVAVELPAGIVWKSASLISSNGVSVQQHQTALPASTLQLDLGTLPTGLYLLNIDTNEGQVRRKIVRE
ncbi:M4 family metallopeptidase [Fibrella sp. WM1]|uniref:M4 family metallopeptidase n=1 Tax=Fibrella musci TaxID=3242485 RepID=UPI003520A795